MVEQLSRGMTAALAAGDVDAARVAHEAIGKLLALPSMPAERGDAGRERVSVGG